MPCSPSRPIPPLFTIVFAARNEEVAFGVRVDFLSGAECILKVLGANCAAAESQSLTRIDCWCVVPSLAPPWHCANLGGCSSPQSTVTCNTHTAALSKCNPRQVLSTTTGSHFYPSIWCIDTEQHIPNIRGITYCPRDTLQMHPRLMIHRGGGSTKNH